MKGGEEKMKHIVTISICLALILGIAGSVQAQAKKRSILVLSPFK